MEKTIIISKNGAQVAETRLDLALDEQDGTLRAFADCMAMLGREWVIIDVGKDEDILD